MCSRILQTSANQIAGPTPGAIRHSSRFNHSGARERRRREYLFARARAGAVKQTFPSVARLRGRRLKFLDSFGERHTLCARCFGRWRNATGKICALGSA